MRRPGRGRVLTLPNPAQVGFQRGHLQVRSPGLAPANAAKPAS